MFAPRTSQQFRQLSFRRVHVRGNVDDSGHASLIQSAGVIYMSRRNDRPSVHIGQEHSQQVCPRPRDRPRRNDHHRQDQPSPTPQSPRDDGTAPTGCWTRSLRRRSHADRHSKTKLDSIILHWKHLKAHPASSARLTVTGETGDLLPDSVPTVGLNGDRAMLTDFGNCVIGLRFSGSPHSINPKTHGATASPWDRSLAGGNNRRPHQAGPRHRRGRRGRQTVCRVGRVTEGDLRFHRYSV